MKGEIKSGTKRYAIGDSCICWSLGEEIDLHTSGLVLTAYKVLKATVSRGDLSILDIVPTYNSLAVYFDPVEICPQKLIALVDDIIGRVSDGSGELMENREQERATHRIPVVYNGIDLQRVAHLNNLGIEEVISFHLKPTYTIAMIGFLPHYPYLIGLDPKLATPRLDKPRSRVPAGAVAIAGNQAGIYPQESPGGWNLLGITDPELLKPMNPGDVIIFKQVDQLNF